MHFWLPVPLKWRHMGRVNICGELDVWAGFQKADGWMCKVRWNPERMYILRTNALDPWEVSKAILWSKHKHLWITDQCVQKAATAASSSWLCLCSGWCGSLGVQITQPHLACVLNFFSVSTFFIPSPPQLNQGFRIRGSHPFSICSNKVLQMVGNPEQAQYYSNLDTKKISYINDKLSRKDGQERWCLLL